MPRIVTNTTYESFFWVEWNQVSQDIPGNKTKISWACGVSCGHSFYLNAIRMSAFTINGVQVYGGGTYSNFSNGNHTIASGTLDIQHDADGTKTFEISAFSGWLYSNYNYSANATSHALTAIARAASITSAPDFKDTDDPTITYSNPAGDAVTSLIACISFTGEKDDIAYRDISKTGSSYQFVLTEEERAVLRNGTTGTERNIQFFVRSKIGNNTHYSILNRKLTIAESEATRPTVTLGVSLVNGFEDMYIQGKSRVAVVVSGEGKYGSSISNLYATVDGKTYSSGSFTSDAIQGSGEVKIIGYAKDSRGFTGSAEQTVNVIPYAKPMVVPLSGENAILCYRSDGNGNRVGASTSVWIKAKRSYYSVSGKNTCTLEWRWKYAAEEWNDGDEWMPLLSSTDATDEYNAMVRGTFDVKNAYTVQLRATDDLGEYDIKTLDIPTQDVALHLGYGGKNVTIGEYCDYSEERTFRSAWKAIFDDEVIVQGKTLADYIKSVMNGG